MKNIWVPVIAIVIILYTLIGTASADWFALTIPYQSPLSEPLSMIMLGVGLIGLATFVRKSIISDASDKDQKEINGERPSGST